MDPILAALAAQAGIHIMGVPNAGLQIAGVGASLHLAMDAQPTLVTTSNAGIPAFLSTYLDPKVIEILLAPMKAAEIAGLETKKGDWLTETAMFPVVESTGETSSYGDFSENGRAGANTNYVNRQSYNYQVMTEWGEKELARAGLGKIDWANRLNIASALTLNKYQNKTYFLGVQGLENYGILNDPALPAAIAPTASPWASEDSSGIYTDIVKLYTQLNSQMNGLADREMPMTLALSNVSDAQLTKTNQYNVNVTDQIKKNFPNLKIKTAPEYATASGNLVQLFPDEVEGQRTMEVGFTEKMRAHPIVVGSSSFKQKKSQGSWGAIIYRPIFVAQMLGV